LGEQEKQLRYTRATGKRKQIEIDGLTLISSSNFFSMKTFPGQWPTFFRVYPVARNSSLLRWFLLPRLIKVPNHAHLFPRKDDADSTRLKRIKMEKRRGLGYIDTAAYIVDTGMEA